MKKNVIMLLLLFISVALYCDIKLIAGSGDGRYLSVINNRVVNEKRELLSLKANASARLSETGACFALTEYSSRDTHFEGSIRVISREGIEKYAVSLSSPGICFVSDSGACVVITIPLAGINSGSTFTVYNADGEKCAEVKAVFPGECTFSANGRYAALPLAGESTQVINLVSGEFCAQLPYARRVMFLDETRIFLLEREWMALYDGGEKVWHKPHNLYYPRLMIKDKTGERLFVGCHHEAALLEMKEGNLLKLWKAPGNPGIISIDASPDFSLFALGTRSLDGYETCFLLDKEFNIIAEKGSKVEKPSGIMPVVLITDHTSPAAMVVGQEWEALLGDGK